MAFYSAAKLECHATGTEHDSPSLTVYRHSHRANLSCYRRHCAIYLFRGAILLTIIAHSNVLGLTCSVYSNATVMEHGEKPCWNNIIILFTKLDVWCESTRVSTSFVIYNANYHYIKQLEIKNKVLTTRK